MKVKFVPQNVEYEIKPGEPVMHVAQDHGLYIKSVCKGVPSCAECRVRVVEGDFNILPPATEELGLIGTGYFIDRRRLSCQLKCFGDITVDLSEQLAKQADLNSVGKKLPINDRVEQAVAIRSPDFTTPDDSEEPASRASAPVAASASGAPILSDPSASRPGAPTASRPSGPTGPRSASTSGGPRSGGPGADSRGSQQRGGPSQNAGTRQSPHGGSGRSNQPRPATAAEGSGEGPGTGGSGGSGRRRRRRRGGKGPGGGGGASGPPV